MPPAFSPPYSVQANDEPRQGETAPMRHFLFKDKLVDHPQNIDTMWGMYLHGNKIGGGL